MIHTKEFAHEMRSKNLDNDFPEGIACGCKYRVSTVKNTKRFFVLIDVKGEKAVLINPKTDRKKNANLSELIFFNRIENRKNYERLTKHVSVRDIKKDPNKHLKTIWEDLADYTANNSLKDSIDYFQLYSRSISDAIITHFNRINKEIKNENLRLKITKVIDNNIRHYELKA